MPANTNHPSFPDQPNPEAKLWRYMPLEKFLDLALRKRLYLGRADRMEDVFEGALPRKTLQDRKLWVESLKPNYPDAFDLNQQLAQSGERMRSNICLSCWHMSEHESAAMWSLYGGKGPTLAIQTTYGKLVQAMPEAVISGRVRYLDFESEAVGVENLLHAYGIKRLSFEHEKEVRFLTMCGYNWPDWSAPTGIYPIEDRGAEVDFDFNTLVDRVFLSPQAQDWILPVIFGVCDKLDLTAIPSKSPLYSGALY